MCICMQGKHSKNSSNSMTFKRRTWLIWIRLVHRFYYAIAEPYVFMYVYVTQSLTEHQIHV